MRLVHFLQHGLSGTGTRLHGTDFVPASHPLRQWAESVPWAALVRAIEPSVHKRFPTPCHGGRRPVPIRVLCALEVLKPALGASDAEICPRVRTDGAVMDACGLRDSQVNPAQAHWVCPETRCAFRCRIDEALMDELLAIQAAAAMDAGLVSPAPLVIDPFPCAQGRPRVTAATTLYKAPKNRSS